MFTVYNNGSVQFRSTSDNLYNLKKVDKSAESRHKPDDEMFHFLDNNNSKNKKDHYTNESISSYKKMADLSTIDVIHHVLDIMTADCISIHQDETLRDVYELLKEKTISQVPIIGDAGKIISMINIKDILNLLMQDIDNGDELLNKSLYSIYLPNFVTTDPITDIRRVAKVMLENKIDAIPVVNKREILVGIVSKSDIIKAISHIDDLQFWA
jgi:CBS domain-containing protein